VIVEVLTSEPCLYGVGCATHRERPLVVATALEQYFKPFVIGRNSAAHELPDLEDQVRKWMADGYQHVRVQLAVTGFSGYGVSAATSPEVLKCCRKAWRLLPFSSPRPM
jgi:hypothetical protein